MSLSVRSPQRSCIYTAIVVATSPGQQQDSSLALALNPVSFPLSHTSRLVSSRSRLALVSILFAKPRWLLLVSRSRLSPLVPYRFAPRPYPTDSSV